MGNLAVDTPLPPAQPHQPRGCPITTSQPPQQRHDPVAQFAAALRALRTASGNPSLRTMASRAYMSRTTLAHAMQGERFPTLDATLAFVRACDGDADEWRDRWHRADQQRAALAAAGPAPYAEIDAAHPPQALADGSDPERASCHHDAITVHARKIALTEHLNIGHIQLRYSPSRRAAWGRFEGYSAFDHMATSKPMEVEVHTIRRTDNATQSLRQEYCFDFHWSHILLAHTPTEIRAQAVIYAAGTPIAEGTTNWIPLG